MEDDENSKEDFSNMNSLIKISRKVFEFIKSMGEVSVQDVYIEIIKVTEYMEKEIKKNKIEITFKNIQRRVYDAINVISAVGLISKRKSNLVYDDKFQIYETKSIDKIEVLFIIIQGT